MKLNLKYSAISKVLPCVYDDSLSYYEVLCKVRDKLNEVIDIDNAQSDAINDLGEQSAERYNEFEQRILHDLEEMENKLEGEISAGDDEVLQTLSELIANLSNEIDDVSATISGIESSVADAVQTANSASEAVTELSEDVETVTQNVADLNTAMSNVDNTLQQMNGRINTNASAIATNAGDISSLSERVTDIEEEIEGGMVFADVDSTLSTTSTNPVENQAITRKIQQVEGDIPTQLDDLSDVSFSNPSAGQIAGFDSNGNLTNMNAPAGVTVVDNLNSTSGTDALSANQGRVLNENINTINGELGNQTYGLQAIKDAVDDANDELTDSSHGLSALDALIQTVGSTVSDVLSQVADGTISSNLRAVVEGILTALNNNSTGLGAIKTAVDSANNALGDNTNGLAAIKTAVDAIGSGGSVIKSIQSGTIAEIINANVTASETSRDTVIPINTVDPSKCIVLAFNNTSLHSGFGKDGTSPAFTLTANSLTIKRYYSFYQNNSSSYGQSYTYSYPMVTWQLIEFN